MVPFIRKLSDEEWETIQQHRDNKYVLHASRPKLRMLGLLEIVNMIRTAHGYLAYELCPNWFLPASAEPCQLALLTAWYAAMMPGA